MASRDRLEDAITRFCHYIKLASKPYYIPAGLQEIATTDLRPDLVLWSETQHLVEIAELILPRDDTVEITYGRNKIDIQS